MDEEKDLFDVVFEAVNKGCQPTKQHDNARVVAVDAEAAIAKVRKREVGSTFDWEDDDGKKITDTIGKVVIYGVSRISYINIL